MKPCAQTQAVCYGVRPFRSASLVSLTIQAAVLAALSLSVCWGQAQAQWSFDGKAEASCKQKPDSAPPVGEHWYYQLGSEGQPCWHLKPWATRTSVHPSIWQPKRLGKAHSSPKEELSPQGQLTEQPQAAPAAPVISALPHEPLAGDQPAPTKAQPVTPHFVDRWKDDTAPVQVTKVPAPPAAPAPSTTEPPPRQALRIQVAESPRGEGSKMLGIGALFVVVTAGLGFWLAVLRRPKNYSPWLYGPGGYQGDAAALRLEVPLIPDLVNDSAEHQRSAEDWAADYRPLNGTTDSAAILEPTETDKAATESCEPSSPSSPELEATLADLLRRLMARHPAQ